MDLQTGGNSGDSSPGVMVAFSVETDISSSTSLMGEADSLKFSTEICSVISKVVIGDVSSGDDDMMAPVLLCVY